MVCKMPWRTDLPAASLPDIRPLQIITAVVQCRLVNMYPLIASSIPLGLFLRRSIG